MSANITTIQTQKYLISHPSLTFKLYPGGLSLALGLSEVKCKRHYYRDLSGDQLGLGYSDFNTLGSGGLSGYGLGLGASGLGGHTNLGFSSDNLSVYGSKPGLYMTPHTEEDRRVCNHKSIAWLL